MKVSYLIRRIWNLDYAAMNRKIEAIAQKTGRSRLDILRDMQECAIKYGAGYMDYDLYEMYTLSDKQRQTFITRGRNNDLMRRYDDPAYAHVFLNKDEFNEAFEPCLHRDWAPIGNRQRCLDLITEHDTIFAKPVDESCGKGVEKLSRRDFESPEALYDYVAAYRRRYVLEEAIRQHPQMNRLYPDAINTIRVVTILKDGVVHVIIAVIRIGNHGKAVDNFNNGGMTSPVDEKTGVVKYAAMDKQKNVYEVHPMTGTPIRGFQIPCWSEVLSMVKKAALVVPQMAYVGWDVGIGEDGPLLVEGNDFPGHDLYQLKPHTPDGYGVWPKFQI